MISDPEDWDKMVDNNEDTQSLFEIKVFGDNRSTIAVHPANLMVQRILPPDITFEKGHLEVMRMMNVRKDM